MNPERREKRNEHMFRTVFSLVGLCLVVFAVTYRELSGPAWFEVVGLGTVFFGGSAVWSIRQIIKLRE